MRKLLGILLFLVTITVANAQRTYTFNYCFEYNSAKTAADKPTVLYQFTNSEDNSYLLQVWEKDSLTFELQFIDERGKIGKSRINKAAFNAAGNIILPCESVYNYSNPYRKKQLRDYEFIKLADTLLDGQLHKHYQLSYKNSARAKRKSIGTIHYIIKNGTEFHQPVVLPRSSAFALWDARRNIPNGVYAHQYMIMPNGATECRKHLVKYAKTANSHTS